MSESTPVPDGHKQCGKGGHIKPLSEFGRQRNKDGTYRHRSSCKSCINEASSDRYRSDSNWRSHHKTLRDRWRAENPTYHAEYYQDNRDKLIANAIQYAKDNPPDPEQVRQWARTRYATDPEGYLAKKRRWQVSNIELVRESRRRAMSRRRARLRGLPSDKYTMGQLLERDGALCVLCDKELDLTVAYPEDLAPTVEHLECLDWPDCPGDILTNVAVSHWDCNNSRRTRPHPAAARKRAELLAAEAQPV